MTWLDWLSVAVLAVMLVCVALFFYGLSKAEPWRIMTIERVEVKISDPCMAEKYKARGEDA